METGRERIPWWLWPNILSLDAPVVAVVWLGAFSRAFRFAAEWPVYAVLFLTVWCIYFGDRLFDARRGKSTQDLESRHQFAGRHFRMMTPLLAVAAAAAGGLAVFHLSAEILKTGLVVAGLVGIYFVVFVWRRIPGKEVAAGFLFAAGVVLPAQGGIALYPDRWVPALLIFGLVCGFNCFLIDWNERRTDRKRMGTRDATLLGLAAFTVALIPAAFRPEFAWIYFSLGLGAALLTALQIFRNEISRDAFRALADAALLTPLIWLPFLPAQ